MSCHSLVNRLNQYLLKMLNPVKFIIISLVFFTITSSSNGTEDVCVQKSPCVCVFPNGTGIDLRPTVKTDHPFYVTQLYSNNGTDQYKLINYYFHPCSDMLPPVNSSGPNNSCNKQLSLCRHSFTLTHDNKSAYILGNDMCEFLGSSNSSQFTPDGRSIHFDNKPSGSMVLPLCSQGDNRLHIYSVDDPQNIVLAFYSKDACLKQIEAPGRSVGSTLLIIFFSLVIFYLVLGVCTKKFLMGATGIEVIPNLAFWSDLPNLVRDGWAFAANGFKLPARAGQMSSPDPNSYDSI